MFEEKLELKEKILIIMQSDLADAKILNSNYIRLIDTTPDIAEKEQFLILKKNVQIRIKELTQ